MEAPNNQQQSTAAPFLNESKRQFLFTRLLQTLLGGLILKLDTSDNFLDDDENRLPWFIVFYQLVLFLIPFMFGGIAILISDLIKFTSSLYISIFTGCLFMIYIFVLKLICLILYNVKTKSNNKNNNINNNHNKRNKTKSLLLNNENQISFKSACSIENLNFIIQPIGFYMVNSSIDSKKFSIYVLRIFIDSIVAGFIMFSSVRFQSIIYLQEFYTLPGAIVLFILSWLVLCCGIYALTIREPHEPAIYQAYDKYKIQHFTRAFYIVLFQIIEVIYLSYSFSSLKQQIYWLKIIFLCLPVGWFFGVLPPVDCFILWFFEQCHIFLYGGSGSATNLRLILQLCFSVAVSLIYFSSNDVAIIVILALFGYVLSSIDIIYIIEYLVQLIESRYKSSMITPVVNLNPSNIKNHTNINILKLVKNFVFHFIMIILTVAASLVPFITTKDSNVSSIFQTETVLLYVCIGLFLACKILADLNSVYIFFGLIRNPLYPINSLSQDSIDKNRSSKLFFKFVKYSRLFLIKIVSPLIMCTIISFDCSLNKTYQNKSQNYWRIICILRAFRWCWQSTFLSLFEMSIMAHLSLLVIGYNTTRDAQFYEYFLTGCLVASFARDRLQQIIDKIFAFVLINITSWTIKKQRKRISFFAMIFNFIFFLPIVLPIILLSCILSAPLLPLFTFSFFMISYPRNRHFWPQKNKFFSSTFSSSKSETKNTNNSDSCFYAQLQPKLIESFKGLISSGSIGSSLQPDTYFISRFQDRVIWLQILESSNSYMILNMKGLELQETSCHTREVQYIDDSFELAFENPYGANSNSKKSNFLKLNPNPFNCMSQKDLLIFEGYSDAKNSLIGILDNPDCLRSISAFYPKLLSYFIIKHLFQNKAHYLDQKNYNVNIAINNLNLFSNHEANNLKEENLTQEKRNSQVFENKAFDKNYDQHLSENDEDIKKIVDHNNTTDEWSDDNDSIVDKKDDNKKNDTTSAKSKQSDDNLFDFDINQILGFGPSTTHSSKKQKDETKKEKDENNSTIKKLVINSDNKKKKDNPDYFDDFVKISSSTSNKTNNYALGQSIESSNNTFFHSPLSLPNEWTSFMNQNLKTINSLNNESLKQSIKSKKWLESVFDLISPFSTKKQEILNDYEINTWTSHYKFILKCCDTLNLLNENAIINNYNPHTCAKFFKGDLPYSIVNEKLKKDLPELSGLIINSFRYAIKMAIDSFTIYPITDDQEFFEQLKDYEENWFIGIESDARFSQNILDNKPFIFSVYKDSNTKQVNSRTLSLQKIKSPLARLNSEIIKSIWSSLNLELLYMTNDDDERYSIQAHPYILRNLTIQSSEPPLGYSIYNSDNIYLHIGNLF